MSNTIEIYGHCEPGFEAVKDQFRKNFTLDNEIGASVSMVHQGKTVVDLWAGIADKKSEQAWSKDTIATIFSGTKALSALVILRLVEQGQLTLDAPIANYWPEFATHGKSTITVRDILSHKAGLPAPSKFLVPWSYSNVNTLADHLAKMKPWWDGNQQHGYHAITMGWLLSKLVKNITGKTLGTVFKEDIARPLNLDIHIGLDPTEHHRVARMELMGNNPPVVHNDLLALLKGTISSEYKGMTLSAFTNPLTLALSAISNAKKFPEVEQPAVNGMSNARNLASLYGVLANGGKADNGYQLLSKDTLPLCWEEQSYGHDLILKRCTRFSNGFMLSMNEPLGSYGPGTRSFGHNGMGGSLAFADPDNQVGFGYVMNRMGTYLLVDVRARTLIDVFYKCL